MKLEEREKGNQMEQLVIWQFLLQPYVVYLSNNLLDKREALIDVVCTSNRYFSNL